MVASTALVFGLRRSSSPRSGLVSHSAPSPALAATTPSGIGSGPPIPSAWSGAGPCRAVTFAAIAGRPSPEAAAVDSAAAVAPTTAEAMTAGVLCWGGLVARCRPAGRL